MIGMGDHVKNTRSKNSTSITGKMTRITSSSTEIAKNLKWYKFYRRASLETW